MINRGQGTIEYLVIIAIVIVLALGVVALFLNISDSEEISFSSNKTSNVIGQGGISILDSITGADGKAILSLQNTSGKNLTILSITPISLQEVAGEEVNCIASFKSGTKENCVLTNVNLVCPCTENEKTTCYYKIKFQTPEGLIKTEKFKLTNVCIDEINEEPETVPTYTVTYLGNNNTSGTVPEPTSHPSGSTVTVSTNSGNLERTGYTFNGWNTQANGSGDNYTAGSGTFPITNNTTLYADWEEEIIEFACDDPLAGGYFCNGSGTIEDPYGIYDVTMLQNINESLSSHFVLLRDIDAGGFDYGDGKGFLPIGDKYTPFEGSLDGNDFSIIELTIDRATEDDKGLFGYIKNMSPDVEIKNLTLIDTSITGYGNVGGIAGFSEEAKFTNLSVSGTITGSTGNIGGLIGYSSFGVINNCSSLVNVTGNDRTGGIVGLGDTISIRDSSSSGSINSIGPNTGGIAGKLDNASIAERVYSSSDVHGDGMFVGGIVGNLYNNSMVSSAYSTGAISSNDSYVGGIAGLTGTNSTYYTYGLRCGVINSYFTGTVTGNYRVGGVVGSLDRADLSNCFSSGIVTADPGASELSTGGLVGGIGTGTYLGTVTNSYYNIETATKSDNIGKGTPKTTAQMTYNYNGENTFSAWNFSSIWANDADSTINEGYPYLQWQIE